MTDYKLTNRGKFVLGLVILSFVIMIVYSGSYIVDYLSTDKLQVHDSTAESTGETVASVEATVESEETTEDETNTTETTETTETIYSLHDLEDLKQFKITIYFDKNKSEIQLTDADLDSIRAMMDQYPSEKLSIDGHVNGYPNYETDKASDVLSRKRALNVEKALIDLGIDKKLISVYNLGSEYPLYKDFGNQSKNDRVEIYFLDHYIKGSRGK